MITLLNGESWNRYEILQKMYDDSFYYGHLGKHALSSSSLKKLNEGPLTYELSLKKNDNSNQALRDGRLIHMCLLEPEKINDLIITDGTKAKKEFKEATALHGDHMVYTQSEMDNAYWISEAVKSNDEADFLLHGTEREVPAIEEIDGIAFRAKADAIDRNAGHIIDLKTTSIPVSERSFRSSANNFMYNLQAALYCHIFGATQFTFLVVHKETKTIGIFECSQEFLDTGWFLVENGIDVYKRNFLNEEARKNLRNYVVRGVL